MPAESRLPYVIRALREAGDTGLTLAEAALRSGTAPKTARKHLKLLVEQGTAYRGREPGGNRHMRWWMEETE